MRIIQADNCIENFQEQSGASPFLSSSNIFPKDILNSSLFYYFFIRIKSLAYFLLAENLSNKGMTVGFFHDAIDETSSSSTGATHAIYIWLQGSHDTGNGG